MTVSIEFGDIHAIDVIANRLSVAWRSGIQQKRLGQPLPTVRGLRQSDKKSTESQPHFPQSFHCYNQWREIHHPKSSFRHPHIVSHRKRTEKGMRSIVTMQEKRMIRDIILLLLLTFFSTTTLTQGFVDTEYLTASDLEDKGRCGADENDMDIL